MIACRAFHEEHGAVFDSVDGRETIQHYHNPERTHRAVRNGVGVIELPYSVLVVEGSDRFEYVNNVVTNTVPTEDTHGTYALLLDPQGRIETDMYIFCSNERLLLFMPPGKATDVADSWEAFIQDVAFSVATDEFVVFGVHGKQATEKIASILTGDGAPSSNLSFVRGSLDDVGVTVIRTDDITGDSGYEVVCSRDQADRVLDIIVNHGLNAVLFGHVTWDGLTLEAGTPMFSTELVGRIPNVAGIQNAVHFEKGCFIGQEVVSKVQNRGRPSQRLVGLTVEEVPAPDAAVFAGDASVGSVTRAFDSPVLDRVIAMAYVDFSIDVTESLQVRVSGRDAPAEIARLPFYSGNSRSARIPLYEDDT